MDKSKFRETSLDKRAHIPIEQQVEVAEMLLEKIQNHPVFQQASQIGIYYPIQNEINLLPLIDKYPDKHFYLPNIVDNEISYHEVTSLYTLKKAHFGLLEAPADSKTIKDCELYLIPCVATSGLLRIGYGKGYFDRFLKGKTGYKMGIVYPCLKKEGIEPNPYDILLDEVL